MCVESISPRGANATLQTVPTARPRLLAHPGTPPELVAVFLEMRCLEPPPVNPLQRIQQSAAQQHAARNGWDIGSGPG
jgi:hypothetical protein